MLDFGYYNMDCMEGMKQFPDKYFDLAIVDPPYGDGGTWTNGERFGQRFDRYRGWASTANATQQEEAPTETIPNGGGVPNEERRYTSSETLARGINRTGGKWAAKYGKNHSVGRSAGTGLFYRTVPRLTQPDNLGGNYFDLPPTRCFLIWRKTNVPENFSMAMCEYAWASFNDNAKWFEMSAVGQEGRFHPTQKPVALYKWILTNYAKAGDKILDTHVGSASSLIACHQMGFKYVGFELNPYYYEESCKRLETFKAQITFRDLLQSEG